LGGYAEIYWNAWRVLTKEEGEREALEEAIQDLAYMTIHATNSTTSKNCRVIFDKFCRGEYAVSNLRTVVVEKSHLSECAGATAVGGGVGGYFSLAWEWDGVRGGGEEECGGDCEIDEG
jgi:hypothetical protein